MKQATFFATIILFLTLMGFLRPTSAEAGFASFHSGPFSIASDSQAAQVHVASLQTHEVVLPEATCPVEVNFFDSNGTPLDGTTPRSADCMLSIRRNNIATCDFNPDADGRNPYIAQIRIPLGSDGARGCRFIMTTEVYNTTSQETMAVYGFVETGPLLEGAER